MLRPSGKTPENQARLFQEVQAETHTPPAPNRDEGNLQQEGQEWQRFPQARRQKGHAQHAPRQRHEVLRTGYYELSARQESLQWRNEKLSPK